MPSAKVTPIPNPSPTKWRKGISEGIWRIMELVIEGRLAEAEVRLREELASVEYHAMHAQGRAISRIEQVYGQITKRDPWPADFRPSERIHWRGKLGIILSVVPLPRLLEDLSKTALPTRNLLYYLSAERGKRASRWEMLLCTVREEQHTKDKEQERKDAERFFAAGQVALPAVKRAEPDWVARLKVEREMLARELLAQPAPALQRRREIAQRQEQIGEILAARGYEKKT